MKKDNYRNAIGITIVCEYILLSLYLFTLNVFLIPAIVWAGLQGLFMITQD